MEISEHNKWVAEDREKLLQRIWPFMRQMQFTYDEAIPFRTYESKNSKRDSIKPGLESIKELCDRLIYIEENNLKSDFDEMYSLLRIAGIAAMLGCSRHDFYKILPIEGWTEESKTRRRIELLKYEKGELDYDPYEMGR